jgi:hypothetical protein
VSNSRENDAKTIAVATITNVAIAKTIKTKRIDLVVRRRKSTMTIFPMEKYIPFSAKKTTL